MAFSLFKNRNKNNSKPKAKLLNYLLNAVILILFILCGTLFFAFANSVLNSPRVNSQLASNVEKINNQEVIQVSILNSTVINGLANKVRTYMQMRNFDVVEIGNYSQPLTRTIVIDRLGDTLSAMKVAKLLGVADSLVISQIDSSLFVRTTIIIGQDYPTLAPFN
ncbi:MAG TPA: LytR C-terminal domain-containing protein [Candidatus Kapabacteria bacterium]|jgi:archaellum component FlaF (FlaF/FlaG flagellin family)|nr:LytR C-terminal domain-containing protein [Candidatus Kapabacteria bacterium]HOV91940.1 LytR C-terminal domain-containing protein [Candidatus Kapabacteria bacterium]